MAKSVLISNLTGTVNYTSAVSPNALTAGQIGVYSIAESGAYTLITTTPSAAQLKLPILVAVGLGSGEFKAVTVKPGQKIAYAQTNYVAPIPHVAIAGFDGTTYDLVSGAAGTYGYKLQNLTLGNPPFPTYSSTPYFAVANQATSTAIAQAIVKDINAQVLNSVNEVMPEQFFAFVEMLSNANSVQLVTSAPANVTGTFTVGSTSVTLSGSTVGGSTPLVAGDYLRVGHATTKTLAVYKVASVSGTSVVLETPYVNPSLALGASVSGVALGYIAAATIVSTAAGIRATEIGNVFNGSRVQAPQTNKLINVSCNVNLEGTPVQDNKIVSRAFTGANGTITSGVYTEGNGTYAQIFKQELEAAGYRGFNNRSFLPDNFPLYSVSDNTYATTAFTFMQPAKDYTGMGFQTGTESTVIIATATSTGTQYSVLNTILSAY
jgi:hypothetical protein